MQIGEKPEKYLPKDDEKEDETAESKALLKSVC